MAQRFLVAQDATRNDIFRELPDTLLGFPEHYKQNGPYRANEQLTNADAGGFPSRGRMGDAPHRFKPLYQVWDEEEAWENRDQTQGQGRGEVEGCIQRGAPSHFPLSASIWTRYLLPLLKP